MTAMVKQVRCEQEEKPKLTSDQVRTELEHNIAANKQTQKDRVIAEYNSRPANR